MAEYSAWSHKELDTTECTHTHARAHTHTHVFPLQMPLGYLWVLIVAFNFYVTYAGLPFQKSGSERLTDHPPGGGEPGLCAVSCLGGVDKLHPHKKPPEENDLDASTASKGPLRLNAWLLRRNTDVQ